METYLFTKMSDMEEHHWWFLGRKRIVGHLLGGMGLPPAPEILEIGCGTGTNLELLSRFGHVTAVEPDPVAREFALKKGFPVVDGTLPDKLPFGDAQFDLIVLLDVIEHIENDTQALAGIRRYLKPNGKVFITVPAYKFLWSQHDVLNHHFRRYTKPELKMKIAGAGYKLVYSTYCNSFLMPLIAAVRLIKRSLNSRNDDLKETSPIINKILFSVFSSERFLMPALSLPFGVTLIAVAENQT